MMIALLSVLLVIKVTALPTLKPKYYSAPRISQSKPQVVDFVVEKAAAAKSPYPFVPKGIAYHGGPVIDGGVNVYPIYYGKWSTSQTAIVSNFIKALSPTKPSKNNTLYGWWKINSLYYGSKGKYLSNVVKLKNGFSDSGYSQGKTLNDSVIAQHIFDIFVSGLLPLDTSGIYLFLASSDVKIASLCPQACGYHYLESVDLTAATYKYVVVQNAITQCKTACTHNQNLNGDIGVDSMVTQIGAILAATVTDPEGSAWYTNNKLYDENTSKCTYGKIYGTFGKFYNIVGESGAKYILPQNWNPKTGVCVSAA